MAEEFQAAGVCGGAWWNSPKSVMFPGSCLSSCSMGIGAAVAADNNGFGWQNVDSTSDMKSRLSCADNNISRNSTSDNQSVSGSSIAFAQKLQREADSDSGGSTVTMDSTLQMMGLGFSSSANSSSDWNQAILQEEMNPSLMGSTQDCQGYLSAGFPISPSVNSSYGYSSSSLLQNFYESESSPSLLNNNRSVNNFMSLTSCSNVNDPHLSSVSWAKSEPFLKSTSSLLPSPKQLTCGFNFSNTNTPFWNSSIANASSIRTSSFIASPQIPSHLQEKPSPCHSTITPKTSSCGEVRDSGLTGKKASDEPATKKPRIATPSPLPTFKVRKENLRDQITALQQLVSPFGKTDTASVLQEAIEYIKFLHDQVSALSTPYMKQGASVQQQQISDNSKDPEGNSNQDLRSRGLCLVPISSTFPVANETTADFWTQTFGGNNFR